MTPERIRKLEELSFSWRPRGDNQPWWDVYELLRKHWKQHGDPNSIPTDGPKGARLAGWVRTQRAQYQAIQRGEITSNPLTGERIQALDDIGFIWSQRKAVWMDTFAELKMFRKIHGHCLVPNDAQHVTLHRWVLNQRHFRKKGVAGVCEEMSKWKIKLLDDEGFVWDPFEKMWLERYDELLEFRATYGHCRVPLKWKGSRRLHTWVSNQREAYKKVRAGKRSSLTPERISRLDSVGFHWSPY